MAERHQKNVEGESGGMEEEGETGSLDNCPDDEGMRVVEVNMESDEEDAEEDSWEEAEEEEEESEEEGEKGPHVYLPGDPLPEGSSLESDPSAYVMLHFAQTGAPCLSFDVIADSLGDQRSAFPHTMYLVAGTQSSRKRANHVIVSKMFNLTKTLRQGDNSEEDDESGSESGDNVDPDMISALIPHHGTINRIRFTSATDSSLAATWSEHGAVHVWDVTQALQALDDPNALKEFRARQNEMSPLYTFRGHATEGFGMDWCPTSKGTLATGDMERNIFVWKPSQDGSWSMGEPYSAHEDSVEDIQWSPNEENIFASCSVDQTIRVWDTRAKPSSACMVTVANAHDSDVNVISWNRLEPFILSGGDDGVLKVWDLRKIRTLAPKPIVLFSHHSKPVTTVEWHPSDPSVFASGGMDDQIALWDISLEKESDAKEDLDVPPQLLFIHQGQSDIKELHWHPQISGAIVSTAHSGFNVFKTISV